jgi:hypothetical protein
MRRRWQPPRKIDLERSRLAERSGANLRGKVAVAAVTKPPVELGVAGGRAAPGGHSGSQEGREQFGAAERSRSARRKLVVRHGGRGAGGTWGTGGCCELLRRGDQDLQVWVAARTVPDPML